jgi:hypothetical protein
LVALRWADVDDDGMLGIDAAIKVTRHRGEQRELRDAPTNTGKARRLTLDADALNAIWALRRERELRRRPRLRCRRPSTGRRSR